MRRRRCKVSPSPFLLSYSSVCLRGPIAADHSRCDYCPARWGEVGTSAPSPGVCRGLWGVIRQRRRDRVRARPRPPARVRGVSKLAPLFAGAEARVGRACFGGLLRRLDEVGVVQAALACAALTAPPELPRRPAEGTRGRLRGPGHRRQAGFSRRQGSAGRGARSDRR